VVINRRSIEKLFKQYKKSWLPSFTAITLSPAAAT
jgi:hypothetical protein